MIFFNNIMKLEMARIDPLFENIQRHILPTAALLQA